MATAGIHNADDAASRSLAWVLVGLALATLVLVSARLIWNQVQVARGRSAWPDPLFDDEEEQYDTLVGNGFELELTGTATSTSTQVDAHARAATILGEDGSRAMPGPGREGPGATKVTHVASPMSPPTPPLSAVEADIPMEEVVSMTV